MAEEHTSSQDPNFYDLAEGMFEGNNAVGKDKVCPRDNELGCSLLDTLAPKDKGPCSHFLSWTWAYKVSTVQSSSISWMATSNKQLEEVHLWMCFFVNNQHRILNQSSKVRDGSDNLEDVFEANLLRIGSVVTLLDSWKDPCYLQRIWCIFEHFTAIKLGVEVSMVLPPASAGSFIDEIEKGRQGILLDEQHLSQVDSKSAKVTMESDEVKVKGLIEDDVGFDVVNKCIIASITKWMASEVQQYTASLIKEASSLEIETQLSMTMQWSMSRALMPAMHLQVALRDEPLKRA